jgi:hypothetical protein
VNLEPRDFSSEEKEYAKSKVLQVSEILRKWHLSLELSILEVKKAFLTGKVLSKDSDWLIDQKIIKDFQNKIDPYLGETLEIAILRSFLKMCYKYAKAAAARAAFQTSLTTSSTYEDLLQDSIGFILHSMYYFSKKDLELSTFIGNSLKNNLNRSIRYSYCSTSPISEEDNELKIKILESIRKNPCYTLNEIAESIKRDCSLDSELKIHKLLSRVIREGSKQESRFLHNVPCSSSEHEDIDCLDTLSFLNKLFSPENQKILNLSDQEVNLLRFGVDNNFERGWQTKYANKESLTRQRIGQIYETAVKKIRPFLLKASA